MTSQQFCDNDLPPICIICNVDEVMIMLNLLGWWNGVGWLFVERGGGKGGGDNKAALYSNRRYRRDNEVYISNDYNTCHQLITITFLL